MQQTKEQKRFDLYMTKTVKPTKIKSKITSFFQASPVISPRTIRVENLSPDSLSSEEQFAVVPQTVRQGLATSRRGSPPASKMEQLLGSKRNCRIFKY
jgi:hypothetical protein